MTDAIRLHRSRVQPMAAVVGATIWTALAIAGCQRNSVEHYLDAGDAAMQATKLSEAEQDYQNAVKLAPDQARTHVALGNLYVLEHKTDPAKVEFMKVLEIEPKNAQAHVALGNLYTDEGKYPLAEEQYRAAVALAPTGTSYRLALGSALAKEGKLGEAEAELRCALGLEPKNARAHLAMARLLASQPNRRSEADAEYQQARALDPSLFKSAAATPAPTPAAEAAAPPAKVKIKPLNKLFLLTHSSPVYASPDSASRVVAHVHRRKYVHVVGIAGPWLKVRLRNGTVGFVPTKAAE
jgi:tetratricopeptide (TPR) repeat protein